MPLPMHKDRQNTFNSGLSRVKHVVGVAAGKGGVGKSSVAVQLGRMCKMRGLRVGIMDADVYGPSVRKMLVENTLPKQVNGVIQPAICEGMPVISMVYFRDESKASVVRAPIANALIAQFAHQTDWGDLDYLIVDFPPGTGDIPLTLCQKLCLTACLMVTTPQRVAVDDVRKAINMFERVNVPVLGILENMAFYLCEETEQKIRLFGSGGVNWLAQETGYPILGHLPVDPDFSVFCDEGLSIFEKKPQGTFVKAMHEFRDSFFERLKSFEQVGQKTVEDSDLVLDSGHCGQ